ncbi:QRFP-like peptide receptor [Diadema antillarum]|uniref:QRFP-like peptide receptor n=1 Tax=Diadema antillarum TaxID=105358 RepID=UPI003A842FDE
MELEDAMAYSFHDELKNKSLDYLLSLLNLTDTKDFLDFYDYDFHGMVHDLSTTADILLITCYTIIFVLALGGNLLVIFVVTRKKYMQTAINIFFASLAVSDLLIAVFCIPFTLVEVVTVDWILGPFMCKALNYVTSVGVVSSILTMMAIAIERHQAICHPLRSRVIQTPRRAVFLLGFLWIMSTTVVSPLLFVLKLETKVDPLTGTQYRFCRERWNTRQQQKHYTLLLVVLLYVTPLVIMIVLYLQVVHKLWIRKPVASVDFVPRNPELNNAISLRYKKRAIKMILMVLGLFAACWLPYQVVVLMREFSFMADSERNRLLLATVQLIGLSNSCNNPIVYAFLNDNFKRNFVKVLCSHRRMVVIRKGSSNNNLVKPCVVTSL